MGHDLELESQTQLLGGLQLFTQFSSNLIYVEGHPGSGKSWLAQRFLNTDKEIQTLSFLMCLPSQTADQQRSVLMGQLLADSFCIGDESLAQSLKIYRKDQECSATLIVDDAELLANDLLHELCELVLVAQSNPLWQINVIVFAKPNFVEAVLGDISPIPEIKSLVISPLTDDEAQVFLEKLVLRNTRKEKERSAVYLAAEKIENWPADLLALTGEHHHSSHWVRRILITLIVLLLAMGGWSWWTSYQSRVSDDNNDVMLESSDQQLSSLDQTKQIKSTTDTVSSVDSSGSSTDSASENDVKDLPQSVTTETISVGDEDVNQQKRVTIPSNVVDALVDGDNSVGDNQAVATSGGSSEPTLNSSPKKITKVTLDSKALLSISEARYTLQLAAFTTQEEVVGFINQFELQGQVRVYRTIRNQKEWFIVTYQDFNTIQQTRDAAQDLPLDLQKELPWPKSMAQVHQEIKRVK
ncbi:AAA family ATPase [Vibrio sp. S17_S38]|uniref:AAA family ATPase n=1 Tax=Vibrio sp. S17_S38 TaxID=2720229 RepID=UPI001680D915|nr:AAA family ATPase [Vibrio sp. S17_S38]MBD1573078.1 AAA family ATPase [Vibrio sp. S17_S38]